VERCAKTVPHVCSKEGIFTPCPYFIDYDVLHGLMVTFGHVGETIVQLQENGRGSYGEQDIPC
jgi:hypothetical protein